LIAALSLGACAQATNARDVPPDGNGGVRPDAPAGSPDAPVRSLAPDAPQGSGTNHIVINEVDYDQVGTDDAEFVEIYNPSSGSLSLAGIELVLVNGANDAVYATIDLASAGQLAAGQYLVVAGAGVTLQDSPLSIDPGWTHDAIQNGSPDGLALIDTVALTVVDALSYEGAITSATIAGMSGEVSLVEGTALSTSVADSNTVNGSLCRSPNGQDTGDSNADWIFCTTPTPGTVNSP
jgi:hypothetical protein